MAKRRKKINSGGKLSTTMSMPLNMMGDDMLEQGVGMTVEDMNTAMSPANIKKMVKKGASMLVGNTGCQLTKRRAKEKII